MEHQNLLAIQKRFAQNPNFVLLGVNYQDKEDLARQYLQEHGNNFEHIRDVKGGSPSITVFMEFRKPSSSTRTE